MSERLGRAGLLSLAGGVVGALAGLLLSLLVGRGFGDVGAGTFFAVVAVFTIAANVLELGADTGLVRELARRRALGREGDAPRVVLVALLPVISVGLPSVALLWWVAPLLLPGATGEDARAVVPLALAAALLAVVLGGTRGMGGVLPFTLIWNVGLPLVRPLLVGAVLLLGLDVSGALSAWAWPVLPALLVAVVVLHRQLRRAAPAAAVPLRAEARSFWGFTAPRGASAALEILLSWIDVVLVAALASPAAAGVYAVVSRCATAGLVVETAARLATSPRISRCFALDDLPGVSQVHAAAATGMVLVAWPFYLTLGAFGPAVLSVFGPAFVSGSPALLVLSGAMMLWTASGMLQTALLMGGRSSWQLGNKSVALLVLVVGNVALVPAAGPTGAAIAWAAAIGVDTALATHQVRRRLGVPMRLVAAPLACAASTAVFGLTAAACVVWLGRGATGLLAHLLVAVPLYLLLLLALRHRLRRAVQTPAPVLL